VKITIDVETWHRAHYLGCALADAEHQFRRWGLDEDADFFRRTARAVTKQAQVLNVQLWEKRHAVEAE
jgi:hypothetical protein